MAYYIEVTETRNFILKAETKEEAIEIINNLENNEFTATDDYSEKIECYGMADVEVFTSKDSL